MKSEVLSKIYEKASSLNKTIALPEPEDERVLEAAINATKRNIANIILVGDENKINFLAKTKGYNISDLKIINPSLSEKYEVYVEYLYNLRKEKGLTIEMARMYIKDPVYYAIMMLKLGEVDGVVSGAIHSTADTLRPALQIIKTAKYATCVSSFFLMELPKSNYEDAYIFSDCGLIPNPTAEELAQIAISANDTYKIFVGNNPKVALLSYSTYGTGKKEDTEKIIKAKTIVNSQRKDIIIDGELQLDAAIDKKISKMKANGSVIEGEANVLIFPNLDAGNIGYKLVERFGGASAYGPITQGLAAPVNDVSRGCKSDDILGAIAITALQADSKKK